MRKVVDLKKLEYQSASLVPIGANLSDFLFVHRMVKVRMGPGPTFAVGKEIPVISPVSTVRAVQIGAAMAEHAAGGRTRSPTGLLRSARDLHFDIPTF